MTRSILVFSIALLFATEVFASEKSLRSCLRKAPGMAAGECYEKENSQLRKEQKQLILKIQKELTYCEVRTEGYFAKQALKELVQAQKHWEKFVQHDCAYRGETFGPGTGRGIDPLDCEMEYLRMRNERLTKVLEDIRYKLDMFRDWDMEQGNEDGGFIQCPAK